MYFRLPFKDKAIQYYAALTIEGILFFTSIYN